MSKINTKASNFDVNVIKEFNKKLWAVEKNIKITFHKMQNQIDRLLKRKLLMIYEFDLFVEYFGKKDKHGRRTMIASYNDILRDWDNPFPLLNQRDRDWNIFRNSSHPLEKIKMSYLLHDLLHHNNFGYKEIEDIEKILVKIVPTFQYACRLHWSIREETKTLK
jgi:hypothetical protein